MQTFYQLFGVPEDAPLEVITASWKRLMKQNHPDVNPKVDMRIPQEINRIYGLLKNSGTRKQYDAILAQQRRPRQVPVWGGDFATSSNVTVVFYNY